MKRKTRIVLLIVGITILLLCTSAYLSYIISRKLPALLGEKVEFISFEFSLFENKILFNLPKILIDSTQNDASLHIQSQASQISIEGFSFRDLLMDKEIGVDNLIIDSVFIHLELPNDIPDQNSREQIHLFITELFTSIRVKQLELNEVNLIVTKKASPDTLLSVSDFSLTADEVLVDTATLHNIFPLESRNALVHIGSFKARAGEMYRLTGKEVIIEDTTLTVSDLRLKSVYPKSEFASQFTYEKARIDLNVSQLTSKKLLWDLDSSRLKIHSTNTTLDQARLLVYKDKRPPGQPKEIKPLLSQLILELPFSLTVDTVEVLKSYIEYEQFPVAFPKTGKVFFDNLYASVYNLTNDSVRLSQKPQMTINVQTDFMAQGKLTTNIYLDLTSPTRQWSVNGTLGELPVTYVNQVMTPLVGVTAEGHVHRLDFEFSGNEYDASGKAQFEYSKIKITMHDEQKDKEFVKSLFGNLILRNNNLKEDSLTYKEGEIYFIRYQNKDFFNYLWNSLRVGLMDVVIPFYTNPDLENPPSGVKFKDDDS